MTVWLEFWQVQCCGEPFRLGDRVAWTVRATDTDWLEVMLGTHVQPGVDAVEDHHGGVPEGTAPTRGTVTRIAAVHCRYAPRAGSDSHTSYPAGLRRVPDLPGFMQYAATGRYCAGCRHGHATLIM
jgi:hypothetical protein